MAHSWKKIIDDPNSTEWAIRSEVKNLRQYARTCIERKDYSDAMQALSTAIELTHFSLKKWKMSTRKKNKRMRENLTDFREYLILSMHEDSIAKSISCEGTLDTKFLSLEKPEDVLCNQSKEIKKIYKKFAHCIQLPDFSKKEWDNIVGHEDVKDVIQKSLEYPILFQNPINSNCSATGVLLFGPPGTGKSMIARSVAHKVNMTFFELEVRNVMSKYQGESEKNIAEFFTLAKALKPCVIFIDEIDSLLGKRSNDSEAPEAKRGVTNQLLHATQGTPGVFLIGATNTPWQIDTAFLRRFDYKCYLKLPQFEERKQMIVNFLKNYRHSLLKADIEHYARAFEGHSGSDITTYLKKVVHRVNAKADAARYFAKGHDGNWFPCQKFHPKAQKKTLRELFSCNENCYLPNISIIDFDLAPISKASSAPDIRKFEEFSNKHC